MQQGAKVRSLKLFDCGSAPGLMSNIIEYCENLREFPLSFSSKWYEYIDWDLGNALITDFDVLMNKGIVNENVTNFTLYVNEHLCYYGVALISNKKFLDFFVVFPNIRVLDLTCDSLSINILLFPGQNQICPQ